MGKEGQPIVLSRRLHAINTATVGMAKTKCQSTVRAKTCFILAL